ncbi:MAG TPA: sigma factor-like helix-turn-helix DNA-binding protein, partial [Actinomycetota bacterium]|nr:sigma factor-like helix-turn-helix DNA-binding protein [Actinomycetota bacterium]
LIGIARNVIRNQERSQRRRLRLQARVATTDIGPPAHYPDEAATPVTEALATLREDDRELLTLIAWEGLDHAAAARAMGWSRANFRLRLHRARKKLRERLEATDHPFRQPTVTARPTPEEAR